MTTWSQRLGADPREEEPLLVRPAAGQTAVGSADGPKNLRQVGLEFGMPLQIDDVVPALVGQLYAPSVGIAYGFDDHLLPTRSPPYG
jgi:hypothetical protein